MLNSTLRNLRFFPIVQSDELRGGPSVVVTTIRDETMVEDKLVVAVAGYPELYDFTNRLYVVIVISTLNTSS